MNYRCEYVGVSCNDSSDRFEGNEKKAKTHPPVIQSKTGSSALETVAFLQKTFQMQTRDGVNKYVASQAQNIDKSPPPLPMPHQPMTLEIRSDI